MTERCPIEDGLCEDDVRRISQSSGPLLLARHEQDPSLYEAITILSSKIVIKQHRGFFIACQPDGSVAAIEGDMGELMARLRELEGDTPATASSVMEKVGTWVKRNC